MEQGRLADSRSSVQYSVSSGSTGRLDPAQASANRPSATRLRHCYRTWEDAGRGNRARHPSAARPPTLRPADPGYKADEPAAVSAGSADT